MDQPTKPSRGGKRPGAGRHKEQTTFRYSAMLTEEHHAKALYLGKGNFSLGVRIALERCADPLTDDPTLIE
jgi:hypothetical protein